MGTLGRSVIGGVQEMATSAVRGAQEEGVTGALKGLGEGAALAHRQILVGALDTAQSLTTSLLNTPGAVSRSWTSTCCWLEGKVRGPPFFIRGPICQFEHPYGWGPGRPLAVPGSGTQSWLFCPLISLGLAEAERAMHCDVWSVGKRQPVPAMQAAYWQKHAGHIIRAYSRWFQCNLTSGVIASVLKTPARWRSNGPASQPDHLSGKDQELVTPPVVLQAMCELLVEFAEWQPQERSVKSWGANLTCDLGHKLAPAKASALHTICIICYRAVPVGAISRSCSTGCEYDLCATCSAAPCPASCNGPTLQGPASPMPWMRLRQALQEIWDDW